MKIQILSRTPHAIKVAFTAIRTCYSAHSSDYIWNTDFDKYAAKNDDHLRLIKQIVNHGHTSTLEHITFTFGIEGVSRSLLAQLTRHRVGFSYSVQSQRYVKMKDFNPIDIPHLNDEQASLLGAAYDTIKQTYNGLLELGLKAEDARMVLPNSAPVNLVMSVNLRALLDFYGKRNNTTHAQWEIAEFAESLRKIVVEAEPWTESLFEIGGN